MLALAGLAFAGWQQSSPGQAIRAMLDASAVAWNRGDLDGFVSTYAADSLTTFMAGGQVQHGFAWIRQNYAPRFAPGARRDSLRFERFLARPLGRDFAMVTARYVLFRGDSVTSSGPFTLVLERRGGAWKIIHDHTSSDK
jgi:uncharacterized protein (TIGR02246 family)